MAFFNCIWAATVIFMGRLHLAVSHISECAECADIEGASFLQAQATMTSPRSATKFKGQLFFSHFTGASQSPSPMDPPGALCVNCDQNGAYRQPGRGNCTIVDNERKMVQQATEGFKANPYDTALAEDNMRFVLMALVCSEYLIANGGLDAIMSVIDNSYHMPSEVSDNDRNWFEFRGWQSLSDQSNSPTAAPFIANYGGPNKGIERMVNALKAHGEPLLLKSTPQQPMRYGINRLTLRYEITVNIMGLLMNDHLGNWGDAAVRAGLLEEAVHTMRVEHDHCSPLFSSCAALSYLLLQNPNADTYKAKLKDLGAHELASKSAEFCTPYQPAGGIFMAGQSWGQIHPADQACGVLATLLQ